MTGRGPEAWRASAAAAVEQRMAREQRTEPTPAERAVLERVAVDQRAQQAQSAPPQQSQNAPPQPAQNAPQQQAAIASADEVIANANRHVPVSTQAPADNPELQVFTSGPGGDADAANTRSERETAIAASGEPVGPTPPTVLNVAPFPEEEALRSPPTVPNVAPGPTPTGSSATPPAAVSAQAASDTSRAATPTGAAAGAGAGGTSTAPGASSSQVGNLQLSFEPNTHNQYDRVAYVFKLCMISDLDAEAPDLLTKFLNNQTRKIVIAESGVTTGFAIGDVEIQDSISTNFRNRSNITTGLKIQIIEPYGLTLPDKMFQASQLLGLRNWRLAPLMLQLEFRYIKSDGSLYTPTGSQKLVRVYQLMITEFDAQLKETGSVYDVQASVKGNLGFTDAYQIMPQSHRIDTQQGAAPPSEFGMSLGDNKVSSFFTKLGRTITDMYVQLRQNNNRGTRLPVLIYKFIVMDEELGRQDINFSPEANSRRASFKTGNPNTGEITVSRGQSVTALVDDIMATIKDPGFFFQGLDQGGLIKIPVIECITKNVGWDLFTNDYVREFTFFIRTKLSNRPVPNEEYGSAIQASESLQRARLQEVGKNLKKRYDYYYTGLNTEVINCDIKFNQLHVVPQSLLDVTLPMSVASAVRVNPNDPITPTELTQDLASRTRERNLLNTQIAEAQASGAPGDESAQAGIGQVTAELETRRGAVEQRLETIARASVIPFEGNQEAENRLADISNRSAQAEQVRQDIRAAIERNRQQAGRREYAEDINTPIVDNMLKLSYHADPRDILNSMARPVNIASGGNGNNTADTTRPIVSSILQQIYDKSGQHLIEIDLEIRGDPYWLGTTDLERAQELLKFLNDMQGSPGAAPGTGATPATQASANNRAGMVDKHNQDANILLKFRSGVPPRTDTGFMNLKDDSTFFYGVYTVIECVHEFKSGKFTQKLKAYRDALINIDMLRTAERNSVNTTQPRQVPTANPATAQAAGGSSAGGAGGTAGASNAQLTNPNSSPANLERSTQAAEVGGGSGQTPLASNGYISGNSPEAIAARREQLSGLRAENQNEEIAGGRGRAPQGNVADLIGSTSRTTSLTSEGGLRDPANSILGPRQRLSASEIESLGVRQSVIDEVTARNRAAAGR